MRVMVPMFTFKYIWISLNKSFLISGNIPFPTSQQSEVEQQQSVDKSLTIIGSYFDNQLIVSSSDYLLYFSVIYKSKLNIKKVSNCKANLRHCSVLWEIVCDGNCVLREERCELKSNTGMFNGTV